MTKLSVNLNKVAYLRNTRAVGVPDVVEAGRIALRAGADGLTVHPRPDERHIRRADVPELRALLTAEGHGAELNIEGNPFHHFMEVVEATAPEQCTLVPDEPGQSTSDHGWDLPHQEETLRPVIEKLKGMGARVSLFMDADAAAIGRAAALGVDRVELYTEPYAAAHARGDWAAELERFRAAALAAADAGLGVNAGHDLNLDNLTPFLERVPGVLEVSIGHALIADALVMGLEETVKAYLKIVRAVTAA